jgi:hypothetical protein
LSIWHGRGKRRARIRRGLGFGLQGNRRKLERVDAKESGKEQQRPNAKDPPIRRRIARQKRLARLIVAAVGLFIFHVTASCAMYALEASSSPLAIP